MSRGAGMTPNIGSKHAGHATGGGGGGSAAYHTGMHGSEPGSGGRKVGDVHLKQKGAPQFSGDFEFDDSEEGDAKPTSKRLKFSSS